MLIINLTVKPRDGDARVINAGPAVQVAFEREHNVAVTAIATDQRFTYVYWLAWAASKTGVGFDEWLESVESVDLEVRAPDPLPEAPPAA